LGSHHIFSFVCVNNYRLGLNGLNSLNSFLYCSSWTFHVMNWEIGSSHLKSQGIADVIHCLINSIGIEVAVGTSCDPISSLEFLLGRGRTGVSIVILSNIILGMEL